MAIRVNGEQDRCQSGSPPEAKAAWASWAEIVASIPLSTRKTTQSVAHPPKWFETKTGLCPGVAALRNPTDTDCRCVGPARSIRDASSERVDQGALLAYHHRSGSSS